MIRRLARTGLSPPRRAQSPDGVSRLPWASSVTVTYETVTLAAIVAAYVS